MNLGEFLHGFDREAPVLKSSRVVYCPSCRKWLTEMQAFRPLWETAPGAPRVLTDYARRHTEKNGALVLRRSVGRGGPLQCAECLAPIAYGALLVLGTTEVWDKGRRD